MSLSDTALNQPYGSAKSSSQDNPQNGEKESCCGGCCKRV
jgi:hypothetical protein